MGFKLGKQSGNYMYGGQIKNKMKFGQEVGGDASVPGTPVVRKPLDEGIMGEANMDGSIYINSNIMPGSAEERQVLNHEMRHSTDMKIGKLAYGDDFVKWNGNIYPRQDINGKDMIKVDGQWKEAGAHSFPWEEEANNGNKNI